MIGFKAPREWQAKALGRQRSSLSLWLLPGRLWQQMGLKVVLESSHPEGHLWRLLKILTLRKCPVFWLWPRSPSLPIQALCRQTGSSLQSGEEMRSTVTQQREEWFNCLTLPVMESIKRKGAYNKELNN